MNKMVGYALSIIASFLISLFLVWICGPLTFGTNRTLITFWVTTVLQIAIPFLFALIFALLRRYPEMALFFFEVGLLILFYNLIALYLPVLTTSYL